MTESSRAGSPSVIWMSPRNVCLQQLECMASTRVKFTAAQSSLTLSNHFFLGLPRVRDPLLQCVEIFQLPYETRDKKYVSRRIRRSSMISLSIFNVSSLCQNSPVPKLQEQLRLREVAGPHSMMLYGSASHLPHVHCIVVGRRRCGAFRRQLYNNRR